MNKNAYSIYHNEQFHMCLYIYIFIKQILVLSNINSQFLIYNLKGHITLAFQSLGSIFKCLKLLFKIFKNTMA